MEKYLDASLSPEERADDLLQRMSLDEKMGQVNCVFPIAQMADMAKDQIRALHGIGQISTLDMRMQKTLEEAAEWQRELQEIAMEASEHHIPAVFHMEGLSGAFIQEAVSFPSGIARGSSWDPDLERKVGEIVGRQETACGITQTFAPVLDISRDSRMGRQGETYGEDPALISALGVAYVKGIQSVEEGGRKTEAVAKHFMGFHNSAAGIHGANSDVTPRVLREIYGRSFQAAISEAGLKGIMPCYCSTDGIPASASKELLTNTLRGEMGFDGVVVSDYCAVEQTHSIHRVAPTPEEAGLLCMSAGMDVELPMCMGYNAKLQRMFENGQADIHILDNAVRRILTAKFRMGLFEHPFAMEGEALHETMTEGVEKAVALQSAKEAMVLIKNDGALPLSDSVKRIAVIGPQAVNPRFYFGGYTHVSMVESVYAAKDSMVGVDDGREAVSEDKIVKLPGTSIQSDVGEIFDTVLHDIKPGCKSILEALREKLPGTQITYACGYPVAGDDVSMMAEAIEVSKDADVILLMLGGKYGTGSIASMGEGIDATDINLPACQEEFIRRASGLDKPMIGIHLFGRAISSDAAEQYLSAIVEAWTPSEMTAEAVAEILTGAYNPGGKLPVSVPYNAGQIPVYYNHPNGSAWHQAPSIGFVNYVDCSHQPRYCFGHGLSYTEFTYSGLRLDRKEVEPYGMIRIKIKVTNTGKCAGDEIVQLYIRDLYASVSRPVQELAGFIRLHLEKGEGKTVTFDLKMSQLAFLDRDMKWKIEKGEVEVRIGKSSQDIQLTDSFVILEDGWIEGKDRAFYTLGRVTG